MTMTGDDTWKVNYDTSSPSLLKHEEADHVCPSREQGLMGRDTGEVSEVGYGLRSSEEGLGFQILLLAL